MAIPAAPPSVLQAGIKRNSHFQIRQMVRRKSHFVTDTVPGVEARTYDVRIGVKNFNIR